MAEQHQPWDQQEGESAAAYSHFLIYRNLGPERNLREAEASVRPQKATKGHRKTNVSGAWKRESVEWSWRERAIAWDISRLHAAAQATSVAIIHTAENVATQMLAASGVLKPETWSQLVEALEKLVKFLPPQFDLPDAGNIPSAPTTPPEDAAEQPDVRTQDAS